MENTYSTMIELPQFILELMNRNQLDAACRQALEKARLEEPIKTGNLRRSTNYSIHEQYVLFYINPAYYKETGPYYEYLDDNHTRAAGYFDRASSVFENELKKTFNGFYQLLLRSEQEPDSALGKLYLASWLLFKKKQKDKEEKKDEQTIQRR